MRDSAAERPRLRALDIDVDPLMVAGDLGKAIDARLVDRQPVGRAERAALGADKVGGRGEDRRRAHARWLDTDRISPVI